MFLHTVSDSTPGRGEGGGAIIALAQKISFELLLRGQYV